MNVDVKLNKQLQGSNDLSLKIKMLTKLYLRLLVPKVLSKADKAYEGAKLINRRNLTTCSSFRCRDDESKRFVVRYSNFDDITEKCKESYMDMVKIFIDRDVYRRGHVEFIYSALKHMEEFGVHKDLGVYKAILDILPKGRLVPQNVFQAEFMHYPKQQQCAIDLLQQMEDNGVIPDYEMEDMLLNVFGRRGYPLRKYWRMMYWMPKFKNLSPFPLPDRIPQDSLSIAKLAINRITAVDLKSQVSLYETKQIQDSIDDTWVVSGQSPTQKQLLGKHDGKEPVYVEGAFRIWIRNVAVNYFVLRTGPEPTERFQEPDPDDVSSIQVPFSFGMRVPKPEPLIVLPSVHQQPEGTIFSVCATGTSSKDSLLSWIRHLEKDGNPSLGTTPVVFKLTPSRPDDETAEETMEKLSEPHKRIQDNRG